ncbi:MAG TPA: hypothetical protein PKA33_12965 [Amaricoccus sp.]|uniref:hypothetical protein n=1 Tax=Amaricoccus sp. TaxID=1872485 RepID=UPI002BF76771|nr:hypothetical protein [Amaricoccus sp.]HMR31267.1 hypothetical protein [Geminicoccus sp.]HMU00263.1 hypothetical protein [Amaricoccus sp.]
MRAEPTIELSPRLAGAHLRTVEATPRPELSPAPQAAPAPPRSLVGLLALLVLPALLCAAAAYGGATLLDKVYAARTEILFHLTRSGDQAERFLATQSVVVRSRTVLDPVAAELGVPAERIEKNLSVDFPKSSAVMRIEFATHSQTVALDVIRLVTQRYLQALRPIEAAEGASHQILVPPFLLDEPVWPRPLQATALGGLIGLAISVGLLALRQQRRPS